MDSSTISDLIVKLGLGGAGIFGIIYVVLALTRLHTGEMSRAANEREETQKAFISFVNDNNHQKTELIQEHTRAMVDVGKNIEINTKAIERLVDKLEK